MLVLLGSIVMKMAQIFALSLSLSTQTHTFQPRDHIYAQSQRSYTKGFSIKGEE